MRRAWIVGVVVSCSVVTGMLACIADPDTSGLPPYVPPVTVDGSVADAAQPPVDAAPDTQAEDAQPLADTGPLDSGVTCAPLDLTNAPLVVATSTNGAPPAMTGGSIAPGDYAWTTAVTYFPDGGATAAINPSRRIFRFGATTSVVDTKQYAPDAGPGAAPISENVIGHQYSTSGNVLTFTIVCGADAGTGTEEYTALDGGLVIATPLGTGATFVSTYAKQ